MDQIQKQLARPPTKPNAQADNSILISKPLHFLAIHHEPPKPMNFYQPKQFHNKH